MNSKLVLVPIAAALALSLAACNREADKSSSNFPASPDRTAQGPNSSTDRPGTPSNMSSPPSPSDTPSTTEERKDKETKFGTGNPPSESK